MGANPPGLTELEAVEAELERLRERTHSLSLELARRVHVTVQRAGQTIATVQSVVETPARLRAIAARHPLSARLLSFGVLACTAGFAFWAGRGARPLPPGARLGRLRGLLQPERIQTRRPRLSSRLFGLAVAVVTTELVRSRPAPRRLKPACDIMPQSSATAVR